MCSCMVPPRLRRIAGVGASVLATTELFAVDGSLATPRRTLPRRLHAGSYTRAATPNLLRHYQPALDITHQILDPARVVGVDVAHAVLDFVFQVVAVHVID